MSISSSSTDPELARLRDAIDRLDDQWVALINQRARLAEEVGRVKGGKAIYRPEREAQIIARLTAASPGPLRGPAIAAIARSIIGACRDVEHRLRVAYLGPEGTFSHAAARKQFSELADFVAFASIDEVFRAAEAEQVDFAVVPVVNSTEGFVGRTLDLALQTPLKVCAEIDFRVRQNLMSHEAALGAIDTVYSHAQSLAQTANWLAAHLPNAKRTPVASNAEAARLASLTPKSAAIAGELAATQYQVQILASNIEDNPNNTTRFWVLGRQDIAPSGNDKTSLAVACQNEPGAIHKLIEPLARHGVSMTHIESRPMAASQWEYVFMIDLQGHARDPKLAQALAEMQQRARLFRNLGSYPAAVD